MTRYSGLINADSILGTHAYIIGVGAIGYQIARSLATMGVPKIHLADFDKVEEANLGTQGWSHADLKKYKVAAAKDALEQINPEIEVTTQSRKWERDDAPASYKDIVFLCVDTMAARKEISQSLPNPMIDSRMSALTIQTLYLDPMSIESCEEYEKTLFEDSDAFQAPCTSRSTYFTAAMAAALAINTWRQHLDGFIPLPHSTLLLDQMILMGASPEPPAVDPSDSASAPAAPGAEGSTLPTTEPDSASAEDQGPPSS